MPVTRQQHPAIEPIQLRNTVSIDCLPKDCLPKEPVTSFALFIKAKLYKRLQVVETLHRDSSQHSYPPLRTPATRKFLANSGSWNQPSMRYGLYAPQITVQDLLTKATSYLLVKLTERLIISR